MCTFCRPEHSRFMIISTFKLQMQKQICVLVATSVTEATNVSFIGFENGHTVNDTLYPVSKQFKRAYGPDILCMEK